jgi:hypothetical protein
MRSFMPRDPVVRRRPIGFRVAAASVETRQSLPRRRIPGRCRTNGALSDADRPGWVQTSDLSRVRRELPATLPSVYSSDQTLAFSREGQPESVMCLLGSSKRRLPAWTRTRRPALAQSALTTLLHPAKATATLPLSHSMVAVAQTAHQHPRQRSRLHQLWAAPSECCCRSVGCSMSASHTTGLAACGPGGMSLDRTGFPRSERRHRWCACFPSERASGDVLSRACVGVRGICPAESFGPLRG